LTKLAAIEGIGDKYAAILADVGVRSVETLLDRGATARGRKELAEKTGIGHEYILDWVNRADLFRIPGIGEQYSDLLEKAGVDTVVELTNRTAEHLTAKMAEVNSTKNLVNRLPSQSMVEDWIKAAKSLPRVVEY
jgi:predicted flap endonuclease-1-like 5' DNA nuclease